MMKPKTIDSEELVDLIGKRVRYAIGEAVFSGKKINDTLLVQYAAETACVYFTKDASYLIGGEADELFQRVFAERTVLAYKGEGFVYFRFREDGPMWCVWEGRYQIWSSSIPRECLKISVSGDNADITSKPLFGFPLRGKMTEYLSIVDFLYDKIYNVVSKEKQRKLELLRKQHNF